MNSKTKSTWSTTSSSSSSGAHSSSSSSHAHSTGSVSSSVSSSTNGPHGPGAETHHTSHVGSQHHTASTSVRVRLVDDVVVVTLTAPGLRARDLSVDLNSAGDGLTLCGRHTADDNDSRHRFDHAVGLPVVAQRDGATAVLQRGNLRVELPRRTTTGATGGSIAIEDRDE